MRLARILIALLAALAAGADHFLIKATESGRLPKVLQALARKSRKVKRT